MKLAVVFIGIAGLGLFPMAASAACDISFQVDGQAAHDKGDYRQFIDQDIRPMMVGTTSSDFSDVNVTTTCMGKTTTAVLHMQKSNYYILAINGQTLTSNQYTYKTSDIVVSQTTLERAVADSQDIAHASDKEINDWVKIFAYFFAESARFTPIEDKADGLLASTGCGENWIDTVNLVRRWGKMSRLAVGTHQTQGMVFNKGRTLAAPLGATTIGAYNQAANDPSDPGRAYVEPRDIGHTIDSPDPSCEIVTNRRGFLSTFKFIFSKPAADAGIF